MNSRNRKFVFGKDRAMYFVPSVLSIFLLICLFNRLAMAQDLINSGRLNNSGTIRIKNKAVGLHDSIGGVFDYFGVDQTISAIQYQNLILSGSGVKQTSGGDFSVFGNVIVGDGITLKIENGFTLNMGGRLTENGYLNGSIRKNVDLSGSTVSSDFGNIGAQIEWSGINPGSTTTIRTSGIPQTGKGNESILRYYDVFSAMNSGLNVNLVLKYSNNELNGNDPTRLLLWKSIDSGKTWKIQGGYVDTVAKTISKRGITSLGRFTMSDSLHPLGSLRQSTGILTINSGNNQNQSINSTLLPFVVVLKDSEGVPFDKESVVFSIIGSPNGSSGFSLSQSVVQTDSNGIASTTLTLGNKVGNYLVAASYGAGTSTPVIFSAMAYSGVASSLQAISGNNQTEDIGSFLPSPLIVSVGDIGGNAVIGQKVHFSISESPQFSTGQTLSDTIAFTDSLGQAATNLKLGSKWGDYKITATISSGTIIPVVFNSSATAFLADANGDKNANVGDLTTVFDKVLTRVELSPENFTRADVDSNNVVDIRDAVIILGGLLKGKWDSTKVESKQLMQINDSYTSEFEITKNGLRFNLDNKLPVKGIQIALKFKKGIRASVPDVLFNRAKQMQIPLQQDGDIIHIVINNNDNVPIEAGDGSIFRLPLSDITVNDFDVLYVIVSTMANEGVQISAQKNVASTDKYPATFALEQNYPNPFNGETKIPFHVPDGLSSESKILLQIFDISGKKIRTLFNADFEAGNYTTTWDGRNDDGQTVASGVYIYRVSTKDKVLAKRMMFVK